MSTEKRMPWLRLDDGVWRTSTRPWICESIVSQFVDIPSRVNKIRVVLIPQPRWGEWVAIALGAEASLYVNDLLYIPDDLTYTTIIAFDEWLAANAPHCRFDLYVEWME